MTRWAFDAPCPAAHAHPHARAASGRYPAPTRVGARARDHHSAHHPAHRSAHTPPPAPRQVVGFSAQSVNPFLDDTLPADSVFVDEFTCIGASLVTGDW